ncbi:MAG: hypothetical protein L3K26_12955, partial [Candidatus Hydrogenedentes bacterium]|nr:hypothetical protein [Candidatus Hydrogenedentota bacterium]
KVVYFVGIMTGLVDTLGYGAHFYGPYSSEVTGAVSKLKALGFVDASTSSWGGVDARGFEIARTDYQLNEDGKLIAEKKVAQHPELWQKMKNGVSLLERAGNLDYMKLSIAAKTDFMIGTEKEAVPLERLSKIAQEFNWDVSQEQVEEAARFLESLHLVKLSST